MHQGERSDSMIRHMVCLPMVGIFQGTLDMHAQVHWHDRALMEKYNTTQKFNRRNLEYIVAKEVIF